MVHSSSFGVSLVTFHFLPVPSQCLSMTLYDWFLHYFFKEVRKNMKRRDLDSDLDLKRITKREYPDLYPNLAWIQIWIQI